jgi:SAM-dependent methyltransferase
MAQRLQTSHSTERFRYVDPPFVFNSAEIVRYPAEVTGYHLLASLCRRLGWSSLAGKRLLDFGCGVRFARTIANLDLDIGLYAGVDVNAAAIAWLAQHLTDPRFRFVAFEMRNAFYNAAGTAVDPGALGALGLAEFDAASMFSVITHQVPDDARLIFEMLHRTVRSDGRLYFTAHTDDTIASYCERDPALPCRISTYHPRYLAEIVASAGWEVEDVHPPGELQRTAFVCRRRERG